ncbi:hypothetical protein D6825_03425 [Candidatus Woesearchaeota archaeon]|nr:MAG: hypothetical protein D6825_03425 [Candidatus Woesearchaeota archaeon]
MTFPVVDAFLLCPEEGKKGKLAICTNTIAPAQVSNEIPFSLREDIAVMGSLVVNRDGAERMIINSLAHPSIEYLVLFGEETASFCPSTNLLQAIMRGYRQDKPGNFIKEGRGVAHNYPSISPKLLEMFKERMKIIPLYTHNGSEAVIDKYLGWEGNKLKWETIDLIKKIRRGKLYYNALTKIIEHLHKIAPSKICAIKLDPKDFQHLQPPIIELDTIDWKMEKVPFEIKTENGEIIADVDAKTKDNILRLRARGSDSFILAYALMKKLNEACASINAKHQLLLGYELSRAEIAIKNNIQAKSLTIPEICEGEREQIETPTGVALKADKKYYYKIGIKEDKLCVQSMSHDTCTRVFELRAKSIEPIIERLAQEDRFDDYEQQFLHRTDVGIEAGRASIALANEYGYFQDFRALFKINTTEHTFIFEQADTFLAAHKKIITSLYTRGLTAKHPDEHKGSMRSGTVLAAFRGKKSLEHMPEIYSSGSQSARAIREDYARKLSSKETGGTYTYGSRTRAHFGYDQLEAAAQKLKQKPDSTAIIQRFDYNKDMRVKETIIENPDGTTRTRIEATKDPCLTHDIYFIAKGKLNAFHIARAHNIVNAYPENVFGLHDAYDKYIADKLELEIGDTFVLSSRANILLLTEEQKAKKLIAEPAKPCIELDTSLGPFSPKEKAEGVGLHTCKLKLMSERPDNCDLEIIENYNSENLLNKAIDYLKKRGTMHNNPIIGTYDPKKPDRYGRLAFFQCNNSGGKLHSTAVFVDGSEETLAKDVELCNYLSSKYSQALELPLGELTLFYAPMRKPKKNDT